LSRKKVERHLQCRRGVTHGADNASCESFIKTLEREEIYANKYADMEGLRNHIEEFIGRYYNQKRLHSALGYVRQRSSNKRSGLSEAGLIATTVTFFWKSTEESSTPMTGKGAQTLRCAPN